jgi:hypothetical protein
MNKYLMRIKGYFSGWEEFEVDAEDKDDAVLKATEFCKKSSKYGIGGNYDLNSIKCVKKLKK